MDIVNIRTLLISTAAQHHELGRQYQLLTLKAQDRHCEWLLGYLARSERWASRNIRQTLKQLSAAVQEYPMQKTPEWVHGELAFYVADADLSDHETLLDTALHLIGQLTEGLRLGRDQMSDPVGRNVLQQLINVDVDFQSHLAHSMSMPLHLVPASKVVNIKAH